MKCLGFAIWCGAWAACQVPNPAYRVNADGDDDLAGEARQKGVFPNSDAAFGLLDAAFVGQDAASPPDGSATPLDTAPPGSDAVDPAPDLAANLVDARAELGSLSQGLIAHITADEGKGTWLSDKAGGPAMQIRPVSSWVPGRTGLASDSAVKFASGGWAGTFPNQASEAVRNLSTQMSVALWLNWEFPSGQTDQALSGYAGKLWYFRLGTNAYRRVCVSLELEEPKGQCGTQDVPLNQWVHVAFTWDNVFFSIYVNGQLQSSSPATGSLQAYRSSDLSIGAMGGGGNPFAGALDDFRIYDRALTASEVAALAR